MPADQSPPSSQGFPQTALIDLFLSLNSPKCCMAGKSRGASTHQLCSLIMHTQEKRMGKEVSLFPGPCCSSQSLKLFCHRMHVNLHVAQENPEGQFSLQDARRYISSILRFHFSAFYQIHPFFFQNVSEFLLIQPKPQPIFAMLKACL